MLPVFRLWVRFSKKNACWYPGNGYFDLLNEAKQHAKYGRAVEKAAKLVGKYLSKKQAGECIDRSTLFYPSDSES